MKELMIPIFAIGLTGCSGLGFKEAPVVAIDCPIPEYSDPTTTFLDPAPVNWNDLSIIILTPSNADEAFDKLDTDQRVFFAITDNGYEALSLNLAELKRYIKDQKVIIAAYKKYFEEMK